MPTAISVKNLGKKYVLRHQRKERYTALRDVLASGAARMAQKLINPNRSREKDATVEEFWALKDVDFDIQQGDRVGIIGRNGAGKSTLLKILSRITEPTTGRVSVNGRIASLLEVGTGFHPELTGRENIYLNGAILGMSKIEIKRKFDEIVAFSEVEKFLDTPVKRYSSGMYMRLAFAIAAHLEPEILIVDEVLAVGDAQFQKRCLGKLEEAGKDGRTVLFVSHNMNAIERLCSSCLLLNKGRLHKFESDVRSVINDYVVGDDGDKNGSQWVNVDSHFRNSWFTPIKFALTDACGVPVSMPVSNSDEICIYIEAEINNIEPSLTIGYAIYAEDGTVLYWSYQTDGKEDAWPKLEKGRIRLLSMIPKRLLNEGFYRIELIGGLHCRQWLFEPGVNAPSINLQVRGGLSDSPYWLSRRPGVLGPVLEWKLM